MMHPTRGLRSLAAASLLAACAGCSLFDADEPEVDGSSSGTSPTTTTSTADSETEGSSSTGPSEPTQGIRVFPQYRLVDIDAIVTMQEGEGDPVPCASEPGGVGYLCATDGIAAPSIELQVERDGFEPATMDADVVFESIEDLAVHLVPAGGSGAMWSDCVADTDFPSCNELCGQTQLSCAPASCASTDPVQPHATLARFDSPDCMGEPRAEAVGCETPAQLDGASWLQCCCES